jgi:putative spermidine/putrescine transport system ATP-binding protein
MVAAVSFVKVSRHFGEVRAVDSVSFEVADGEFFSMLGPSGSGKTTCLRLIAGFERPDSGHVTIHGENVDRIPPFDRDVNTVFQDYALFPHMSVLDNVAYSLMVRKVAKAERTRQAEEALDLVRLGGFGNRKPAALSGGQLQRVALARALINHPRVLLLDEPLGALDLKLREQMQMELKALQRKIGITFIYVTHDQQEALSMSDRLAVFNEGRVEQIGSPKDIYEHPATPFVAGFVGTSNFVEAVHAGPIAGLAHGFSVRPERIRLSTGAMPQGASICVVQGTVEDTQYLGASTRYDVRTPTGARLVVVQQNHLGAGGGPSAAPGDLVWLRFDRNAIQVMSGGGGSAVAAQ